MRFLALFLVVLLTVSGISAQDEAPYIYYYDAETNNLIIERADGTDSHIIADVPNIEPVWSPSGKWMLIGNLIVNTSDQTSIETFLKDSYTYYTVKQWSPDDDIVLLVGIDIMLNSLQIQIFDVEQNKILADFETQTFGANPNINFRVHWASDGQQAWVFDGNQLITLNRNGQVQQEIKYSFNWPFDFYEGKFIHFYPINNDGYQAKVIIEDVENQQVIELDSYQNWSSLPYIIYWDSTLTHALIYARPCKDDYCDAWLKLVDWQSGNLTTITPTLELETDLLGCTDYKCFEIWSPSGNFAVLTDTDEQVYLLDTNTGATQQIAEHIHYEWTPDNKLITVDNDLRTGDEGDISLYDPSTNSEFVLNLPDNVIPYHFDFSPDGQFIGLRSAPPIVINRNGDAIFQVPPHSLAISDYPKSGYIWHPTENWAFIDFDTQTSGYGGYKAYIVFSVDGTQRELLTYGQPGFLPERVIPHLSSSH